MSEKTITLELDVAELRPRRIDEDGEFYEISIEELIVERAAQMLVDKAVRTDSYGGLTKRVEQIRDEAIVEELKPRIQKGISEAKYRRTDEYGQPRTGRDAATLAEHAETMVREQLGLMQKPYGRSSDRKPIVETMVKEATGHAVEKELREELDQAKQKVREAISQKGAELLAKMIEDAAAGKQP